MSAEVRPLPKSVKTHDDGAKVEADPVFPGVNASITFPTGDKGGGIHMSTMFLRDDPGRDQEKTLAKLFSVAAVVGLRERLLETKREKANAERLLTGFDAKAAAKEQLKGEIQALHEEKDRHYKTEEAKFRESGRTGTYRHEGAAKQKAAGIVRDIEQREAEIKRIDNDLPRQLAESRKAIENYGVVITNLETEIEFRRQSYEE